MDDKEVMGVAEKLSIRNFFSIKQFEWDVKGFNILTGGMASGKSLCMKLLYFCEQVFHRTIFLVPIDKDTFVPDEFFKRVSSAFAEIFHCGDDKSVYRDTEIGFSFSANSAVFDLSARWDEGNKRLSWTSEYVSAKLEGWKAFFNAESTPDLPKIIRNQVYESLRHDFGDNFPLAGVFLPASRAITAIAQTVTMTPKDDFFQDFLGLRDFSLEFLRRPIALDDVCSLLHIKGIRLKKPIGPPQVEITLPDGRKITPREMSSGQQELLYALLFTKNLNRTSFGFARGKSVFFEEPSTHLFPQEQKRVIEFLVAMYNELKKSPGPSRFFISTHSPFVLNAFNNILDKGDLLKEVEKLPASAEKQELSAKLDGLHLPPLSSREMSAHMIKPDGEVVEMVFTGRDGDAYLYSDAMEDVNQSIGDDTGVLMGIRDSVNAHNRNAEAKNA